MKRLHKKIQELQDELLAAERMLEGAKKEDALITLRGVAATMERLDENKEKIITQIVYDNRWRAGRLARTTFKVGTDLLSMLFGQTNKTH